MNPLKGPFRCCVDPLKSSVGSLKHCMCPIRPFVDFSGPWVDHLRPLKGPLKPCVGPLRSCVCHLRHYVSLLKPCLGPLRPCEGPRRPFARVAPLIPMWSLTRVREGVGVRRKICPNLFSMIAGKSLYAAQRNIQNLPTIEKTHLACKFQLWVRSSNVTRPGQSPGSQKSHFLNFPTVP